MIIKEIELYNYRIYKGSNIIDLSSSAKEIKISLNEPMDFLPGNFVNVFFDINGEKLRRAYSISSSLNDKNNITLSVRLSLDGVVTNYIWKNNMHLQQNWIILRNADEFVAFFENAIKNFPTFSPVL